jgi:hypothetical protein
MRPGHDGLGDLHEDQKKVCSPCISSRCAHARPRGRWTHVRCVMNHRMIGSVLKLCKPPSDPHGLLRGSRSTSSRCANAHQRGRWTHVRFVANHRRKGSALTLHKPSSNPHRLLRDSRATSNRCACTHSERESLKKSLCITPRSYTGSEAIVGYLRTGYPKKA